MKKHIIIISLILFAFVCLLITPAIAQQFAPPSPESRVDAIDKAVKLTAEQKEQILKIYTDTANNGRRGGMRGGFGGDMNTEAVEKVLNPEQVKLLRAFNLKQNVDRRITQIDEAVTLTAEQKKNIVSVIEKEIKAQNSLTSNMQNQGPNGDRQGMMEEMTAIRDATTKALESILTKDQLKKYQAIMPARGGMGRNR